MLNPLDRTHTIALCFDGIEVYRVEDGNVTLESFLPEDYRPDLIEMLYNGVVVYSLWPALAS